jgi:hypothetical protein
MEIHCLSVQGSCQPLHIIQISCLKGLIVCLITSAVEKMQSKKYTGTLTLPIMTIKYYITLQYNVIYMNMC